MDEELYMHCTDCGEAFDSIRTAWEHPCDSGRVGAEVNYTIMDEL